MISLCARQPLLFLLSLFIATTALLPAQGFGHELRPAIATLTLGEGDRFDIMLSLNLEAAMAGIGPEHSNTDDSADAPVYDRLRQLSPAELEARFDAFAPKLIKGIEIHFDQIRVPLRIERINIPDSGDTDLPRISEVLITGASPAAANTVSWRLDPALGDSAFRLRRSASEEIVQSAYVRAGEIGGPFSLDGLSPQTWTSVFASYLTIGFLHIVPKGLDHMLFVVGLFLLSTRFSSLLKQVTAFTIAHTVTLALGATGVVQLPATVVEPLIAASIIYVAVENLLTDRLHRWRPLVVFCFGLLHGLGFAGVLGEIGLSNAYFFTGLIAFNIGVELGQLAVIAACFAAVGWTMNTALYRPAVVVPVSILIAIIAGYWMIDRIGFL